MMLAKLFAALVVLPGASQEISHSLSASRDTALLSYQLTPYSVLTGAGDVGLAGYETPQLGVRLGFFGLLELESARPFDPHSASVAFLPGAGVDYWRGADGFQLAVAPRALGQRLFGEGGLVEATAGLRHESDHHTASNGGGSSTDYSRVPQLGNFVLLDLAARIPRGPFELTLRAQSKVFAGGPRNYRIGPGFDAVLVARVWPRAWLFSSLFGEWLVGNWIALEGDRFRVPDDRTLRLLAGVLLPGRVGNIQIFTSVSVGNGKGLQVLKQELLWGGGIRLALF